MPAVDTGSACQTQPKLLIEIGLGIITMYRRGNRHEQHTKSDYNFTGPVNSRLNIAPSSGSIGNAVRDHHQLNWSRSAWPRSGFTAPR